jgi:hypothetical protein
VLPSDVITYDLPTTNAPAVSTVVNLPVANATQFEVLGNAEALAVHAIPSTEVLAFCDPLDTATKLPPAPTPWYSIAVIAPVVEFTAVIVTVTSFVVAAPPKEVPTSVMVFNLAYPVPAVTNTTAEYFTPRRTTVNVAPVPEPDVEETDTGEYTADVGAYAASTYVCAVANVLAAEL